jgi:hypothetical protein
MSNLDKCLSVRNAAAAKAARNARPQARQQTCACPHLCARWHPTCAAVRARARLQRQVVLCCHSNCLTQVHDVHVPLSWHAGVWVCGCAGQAAGVCARGRAGQQACKAASMWRHRRVCRSTNGPGGRRAGWEAGVQACRGSKHGTVSGQARAGTGRQWWARAGVVWQGWAWASKGGRGQAGKGRQGQARAGGRRQWCRGVGARQCGASEVHQSGRAQQWMRPRLGRG